MGLQFDELVERLRQVKGNSWNMYPEIWESLAKEVQILILEARIDEHRQIDVLERQRIEALTRELDEIRKV